MTRVYENALTGAGTVLTITVVRRWCACGHAAAIIFFSLAILDLLGELLRSLRDLRGLERSSGKAGKRGYRATCWNTAYKVELPIRES